MTAKAQCKIRSSVRKARKVVDLIRHTTDAEQALNILHVTPKAVAEPIGKLLQSAIANYRQQEGQQDIQANQLHIHEIMAEQAGRRKTIRAQAKGRGNPIIKESVRVKLTLHKHDTP